jgi:hypothetical protein
MPPGGASCGADLAAARAAFLAAGLDAGRAGAAGALAGGGGAAAGACVAGGATAGRGAGAGRGAAVAFLGGSLLVAFLGAGAAFRAGAFRGGALRAVFLAGAFLVARLGAAFFATFLAVFLGAALRTDCFFGAAFCGARFVAAFFITFFVAFFGAAFFVAFLEAALRVVFLVALATDFFRAAALFVVLRAALAAMARGASTTRGRFVADAPSSVPARACWQTSDCDPLCWVVASMLTSGDGLDGPSLDRRKAEWAERSPIIASRASGRHGSCARCPPGRNARASRKGLRGICRGCGLRAIGCRRVQRGRVQCVAARRPAA